MQEKTIFRTILAAAVLAPPASADSLLFPVITRSPSVSTLISVVNKQATPPGQLFVHYFNKQPGTSDFQTPCIDEGRRQLVNHARANDLVTWDASGIFQSSTNGGPLFNDPETLAIYGATDFKMGGGTNVARGFLIVDDGTNAGQSLYGEAFLMDIVNGAAWGYRAYNATDDVATPDPLFANGTVANNDPLGEVLDFGNGTANAGITVLPPNEWTTRFFVTPTRGANAAGAINGQRDCETCSASVYISSDKAGTREGLFNRDTTAIDMAFAPAALPPSAKNIVCTAAPSLSDLLPQATLNNINTQGGWGYVQVRPGTSGIIEDSAVVIKLEFNLANGSTTNQISPDTTRTFSGIVNTAVWLRNVDNANGVSGF